MSDDAQLGELLVRENLMTSAQLTTALDFQKSLGGDLRNIVVKLGYVKDSVLAGLVAQEEHVEQAGMDLSADQIDFAALKKMTPELLEKHQVVPLKGGDGNSLILAMADPNDLRAIEEIQFLVNRSVEPAVTTKAAIRKALNHLPDLVRQHTQKSAPKKSSVPADRLKAIREMPVDKLMRAYIVLQIEKGTLSADDLLARANKLGGK